MYRMSSSTQPVPCRRRFAALAMVALCAVAQAAPVTVPNGDFSDSANNGSVGGIIGSGSQTIGSGPWSGRWEGILGVLAAPTLTIGSGNARISGLVGVNVAGLLNNGGSFEQATSTPWQPNRRYTLAADVDAGGVLDLAVLQTGNAGIALTRGATRLASTAAAGSVTISLLSGTTYHMQLDYDTGPSVSGNVGVHLFAEPTNLLTVNLLTSVKFDNVTLNSRLLNPVPAALVAVDASPRSATVGQAVDPPLAIGVLDSLGDPVAGVSVSWTVPASGPSATVTPNPTVTGADGIARPTTTANTIAGSYSIFAHVDGVATPVQFDLTNLPGAPSTVGGAGGDGQSVVAGQPFAAPLVVEVEDAFGNAVPGTPVSFSAPAGGASATVPAAPVTTDANGRAQIMPVANAIAGRYQVHASVPGVAKPAAFTLTNLLDPSVQPIGDGTPTQSAAVDALFSCVLLVQVRDGEQPLAGLAVQFTAPASGPSATLSDGVDSGTMLTVDTDDSGHAWVQATANGIAGDYVVTAHLLYSTAAPIEFRLHNLDADDPLYANGFDGLCIPATEPDRAEAAATPAG